jgi:hypothetical protein
MSRGQEARLRLLESSRAGRVFLIADWPPGNPAFDLEAEMERLRREKGMTDADTVLIASWPVPEGWRRRRAEG